MVVIFRLLFSAAAFSWSAKIYAQAGGRRVSGTHLEVRPHYVRQCKGSNSALRILDLNFRIIGLHTVAVDASGVIDKPTNKWAKITFAIEKCVEAISSNTCSPFDTFTVDPPCVAMMSPIMPWAGVVKLVKPKLTCPMTQGIVYNLRNGTLSVSEDLITRGVRLEGNVWKIKTMIYDGSGGPYICMDSAFELLRVRNKRP